MLIVIFIPAAGEPISRLEPRCRREISITPGRLFDHLSVKKRMKAVVRESIGWKGQIARFEVENLLFRRKLCRIAGATS
jgi:hypothetical protein